jgi:hypothetical protein
MNLNTYEKSLSFDIGVNDKFKFNFKFGKLKTINEPFFKQHDKYESASFKNILLNKY